jgi:hypothetical protein
MRVRRDISSIPHRSASQTWQCIIDLITGPDSFDTGQLTVAGGVMGTIITDEHPSARSIVLEGVGAQLRIYLRYGLKAVEAGDAVDSLNWNPTAGDWAMRVPCDRDNLAWVKASLAKTAPRLNFVDVEEEERAEETRHQNAATTAGAIVVDWNVRS